MWWIFCPGLSDKKILVGALLLRGGALGSTKFLSARCAARVKAVLDIVSVHAIILHGGTTCGISQFRDVSGSSLGQGDLRRDVIRSYQNGNRTATSGPGTSGSFAVKK